MNDVVEAWIDKAEADFATAQREMAPVADPNYDDVCFHAQQCVEKFMKAVLIALGATPPKIHDLAHLSRLICALQPEWDWPMEELRFLSQAAVTFRYPGETADLEDASRSLDICRRLRTRLRGLLALKA